ncbi:MAG: kelch repeat-containing protein [Planctomycetota bacterium]|jgi:hypothetical protein|nr:kelch repeat-containing protein [Planctomycetota bacterium]
MKTTLLALAMTTASLVAQTGLSLQPVGGSLGAPIRYSIKGSNGLKGFLMLTSLKRGLFPLSIIDASDKRTIRVGFDLLALNILGALDSNGHAGFSLPLPNDTNLAGIALLHQCLTFPGTTLQFDQVSDVAVVPLDVGASFHQATTSLASARAFHTVLPLRDGHQLVVGGGKGTIFYPTPWKTSEIWDSATRTFSKGPDLVAARAVHSQTRLLDGRYLLAGGVDTTNAPQNSAEIYDPRTNKFVAVGSMSGKRMGHTATLLSDGKVLVTGGITSLVDVTTAVTTSLLSTEIFDPQTNTWSAGPNLRRPRATHVAIPIDKDRVLIIGGITWRSVFFFRVPSLTNTCGIYDHRSRSISTARSMASPRALGGVAQFANGKVLVAGGLGGDITAGGSSIAGCELYDPTTNIWSATTPLAGPRTMPAGLLFADGRFAIFGGGNGDMYIPAPIATCEIYDPATGKWSALPSLTSPRLTAATTQLGAGGVFVCGGGSGKSGAAIASQELYLR